MGKESAPAAPDYSALIGQSNQITASDQAASDLALGQAKDTLAQTGTYAGKSADVGDYYLAASKDARQWGLDQYNKIAPYASDYMKSEGALSTEAGANAASALTAADQNRQWATDTYKRYMDNYGPIEGSYAQKVLNYNSPARAAQVSAGAKADEASSFDIAAKNRENMLKSYDIDPSQGRYQEPTAYRGAALSNAGTKARQALDTADITQLGTAVGVGGKLAAQATDQGRAAATISESGLKTGEVGDRGIVDAGNLLQVGSAASGTPAQYATYANPNVNLASTYANLTGDFSRTGTSALGNASTSTKVAADTQNTSYQNQLGEYNANLAADKATWDAVGKTVGAIGSLALAPVTGGGSLVGNFLGSTFPQTFGGGGSWSGSSLGGGGSSFTPGTYYTSPTYP